MDLTPKSERAGPAPVEDGKVIRKFTALKQWLNRDPTSPMAPQTPATPKSPDSPKAPESSTLSKHVAIQDSVAVITEHLSSVQTKNSTDASVRITENPTTHPSATGISETSHQDQDQAFNSSKGGAKISEDPDPGLEPETQARELMNMLEDMPVDSAQRTDGFVDIEEQSQRSRASWNISDGLSDGGNQDKPQQYTVSDGIRVSRTLLWLQLTSEPPALVHSLASLGGIHHYKRDIDTETGYFLPEIVYPDTLKTLHEGPSRDHRDIAWRQANMTAELQINREIRSRELLAMKLKSQIKPQHEPVAVERVAPPNAECVVRPATPQDFAAIAAIINMESKTKGIPQVLEWKEVTTADVQKIYDSCRDNLQPFVVATTADDALLDRSNWPDNATKAYQSYLAFRSTQAKVTQEVLGFAYVMEARVGMLGGSCPGSRHTGQVKVIVHPDHRGKLYGSALLDRILVCTAPFHRRVLDYDWQCQNPSSVYEENPFFNRRKYAWVYVETFCDGRDDPTLKQATKFLEKFEFQETCYMRCAVKTDRYYESQWLDLVLWAREAQPRSNIADLLPGSQNL
ncbi:hypothetical protein BBK36DRAFT_1159340 [Trichoderma citrinoviride]|uniref:N-acetyltransferase domain-containing protein n=1 Tax=Trichoderma citrinoviride TaxID=58853 RepID=A0A2T4BAE8_9HYPO|nr:hypothetical protein BBK36DRAFT_1159340 [Trichoderma citrinoviride]PTB66297.1 hypothetical protein BBK36DRAFT_1159340 [Trichoderma citrinoviride]